MRSAKNLPHLPYTLDNTRSHMSDKPRKLPEFTNPPVIEVALAVQFDRLDLAPAQLGVLALRMRELGYPTIKQHPPLQPIIEHFGVPRSPGRFTLELGSPESRHWFVAEDNRRLVQVQSDRLIHNWRKVGSDDEYPRYEDIRSTFKQHLNEFSEFIAREGLGAMVPNQVEVTYVNHICIGGESPRGMHLAQVTGIAGSTYTDGFLPRAEDTRAAAGYVIERDGTPIGRLHINAHTAINLERGNPIVVLNLTARGMPFTPDIDGVLSFMDLGREWVVRGFADVTTSQMHKAWERRS